MKKTYKVILINVIIALVISLLFGLMMQEPGVFLIALGAVSGILGITSLFIGLIVIIAGSKEWGQAWLIGGGVLFLLGVGICGPMLIVM